MLATAPALFTIEIAGQMDLFDQEETAVTETPAPAPRDHMADSFTAVAVLSDGRTVTRTAPGHVFRYMLEGGWNDDTPGVFELDWCWSLEYAEKSAETIRNTWDCVGAVRILETELHPYNSPEAKAARRRAGDCGPVAQQQELAAPTVPVPAPTVPVATLAPAPRKASTRRGPNPNHLTFVVVLSNGQTATRSSKSVDYTHISEVTTTNGHTVAHTWHKSEAAARKNVSRLLGFPRIESARVVPVTGHQYNSAAAKIARATEKAEQAS